MNNCCAFVLSSLFTPFLSRKHNCLHAKSCSKKGKVLTKLKHRSWNADSGKKKKTSSSSVSSLIGCVFPNFRQKRDGPNPSDLDNKVFFPAPTFMHKLKNCMTREWKKIEISFTRKMKIKVQNACFQYKGSFIKGYTKREIEFKIRKQSWPSWIFYH